MKRLLSALSIATLISPAFAQDDFDPVFVFNEVCYTKVPNVDAIDNMAAQLAWPALPDADVEAIRSLENPDIEVGWDAKLGERLFRIGVNQGTASASMTQPFEGFEGARATTCSMVMDETVPADQVLINMQALAGKEPLSANVPEGGLETTTWAGGNDQFKVFLFAKVNRAIGGGLLHVTLLENPNNQ